MVRGTGLASHHTNVCKILWLCRALSSLVFNKSLSKFTGFMAFFTAMLMDFHQLVWVKSWKTMDGSIVESQAQFRNCTTHVPNPTDELSTAKERRLNQFGTAVLVWCGKSVKFDRVCRTFVELNLGSTHGTPSESDVTPVLLQSRTYSVRFGTWKVQHLNQAWADS